MKRYISSFALLADHSPLSSSTPVWSHEALARSRVFEVRFWPIAGIPTNAWERHNA